MASTASARQPPGSQRGRARTAKSCGPDARRLASSLCGDVAARPGPRIGSRKATGARVHRSPRRARRTPLKPSAQGRPGCSGSPVFRPVRVFCTRDHGCQPAPGLPCALSLKRARQRRQSSGKSCRESANACLHGTSGAKRDGKPGKLRDGLGTNVAQARFQPHPFRICGPLPPNLSARSASAEIGNSNALRQA